MKNVLIGISSSIAAYKAYELIRLFKKNNDNVKVILTDNALNFVSPLVLETLSGNEVFVNQFQKRSNTQHINLCDWADVFVLAPASAGTLSKCAKGICDNLLTSVFCAYLGSKKPVIAAPAMNNNMWENPIIQENIETLKTHGVEFVEPETGYLACGYEGKGRLASVDLIFSKAQRTLCQNKSNNDKKIIVTLGGTREKIDSVRHITNASSGKTGSALCDWAYKKGYDVLAISTVKLINKPYETVLVESADEMLFELQQRDFDYLIMAAAVSDFKVENKSDVKITKEDVNSLTLKLTKNPDIISSIAQTKKENQKIIGFCLTDRDLINRAKNKLENKKLDFIIANDVTTALNKDTNKVTIIDKTGKMEDIGPDDKENIAKKILEVVCD